MPVSKNRIHLPSMTPGTTRSIAWLRFGHAGARPKVYIQAAIHAFKEITSPYWLSEKRLHDNKIALMGDKISAAARTRGRMTR